MASVAAVPIFYRSVEYDISVALYVVSLIIEVAAFVHCLLQRKEAFSLVGSIPKGGWLAITGGSAFVTLLFSVSPLGILGFIAVTAAAFYLLDVRVGLREATGGR